MARRKDNQIIDNSYYSKELSFHIEKPDQWVFVPQPWVGNFRERNLETNEEMREMFSKAAVPFITFYLPHDNPDYPLPTVQCSCRWKGRASKLNLAEAGEVMIKNLPQMLNEFTVLEYTSDFILSACRGIFIRSTFSMKNLDGDPIKCLGRMIIVDGPNFLYNIGLTGSAEGEYQCEEEFFRTIQSIKIDR